MELRHLRNFVAVAEERHFGRAAERLGISQPPLSQQIQSLERELGTQLFHRIPRRLELTNAGEVLLEEARWILARAEQAIRNVGRAGRDELGKLCVGFTFAASFNAFVPATIRSFQETYPSVSVTLREDDSTALCRAPLDGDGDVAFIRPPSSDPERIQLDALFDEAMMVALPTGHPLEKSTAVPLAALSGQPFILYPAARRHGLRRHHSGLPGGRVRAQRGAGGPAGVIGDKSGGGGYWRLHCSRLDAADPFPRCDLSSLARKSPACASQPRLSARRDRGAGPQFYRARPCCRAAKAGKLIERKIWQARALHSEVMADAVAVGALT
jgi:DNA-binding transcriptional LysR family regulator